MEPPAFPPAVEPVAALAALGNLRAAFIRRIPGVDVRTDRAAALARLETPHRLAAEAGGFSFDHRATAEQVHGAGIAVVEQPGFFAGVDGLITQARGIVLGIYVADCAAVYLADRRTGAIGLVHSGKKGTEAGIVPAAIEAMGREFGVRPEDLVVAVSPCIRPPHYEIDFAAEIVRSAEAAGVREVHDPGICTADDPERYYSYRREKGQTGRMLALLERVN